MTKLKYEKHIWKGDSVKIGENCKIQPFAFIPDGVTLEDNVFIGPSVVFTNDKQPPSNGKKWESTLVKDGAVIGANATILPGLIIGKGAKVGAGSVVTKDIPDGQVWAGNPARPIKKPWKWAVVGCKGFVAPRHMKSIEEVGDIISIVWDKETNFSEVVKWPEWKEIDAVAICTPNFLHHPIAKAMEDKVILSEKPLSLSSQDVMTLNDNVNTVLQLRYHPEVIKWKKKIEESKAKKCNLTVKMFRDGSYWNGWKGDAEKSGGILFNLGIHYFDLLIHLFGDDYKIIQSSYLSHLCEGRIKFGDVSVRYHVEILGDREGQTRKLEIDGEEVVLSVADNLAYEGLHTEVYKQLKQGNGIKPKEALKSISLVEKLCQDKLNVIAA